MPFLKLQFRPGINRDQTSYTNEGGWYDCDKIRFRSSYPEKIGGWTEVTPFRYIGVCRQMWNWITTFQDNFLALGTNKKVYVEVGGSYYDVTPIRATFISPATNNCVQTTNGSQIVTINITGHGATAGDYVILSGVVGTGSPQKVGGVPITELNKEHEIMAVLTANSFTVGVATAATSTVATGGGTAITAKFQIPVGNPITTEGYGWGTDGWGIIPWGLGSNKPVFLPQRDWWFDNVALPGEDGANNLVMNIRNGAIYLWERGSIDDPTTAIDTPALLLSSVVGANEVPAETMQIMLSQNDGHLLAFGCTPYGGGVADPLLIRWASQDNILEWEPDVINTAGFIRVSRGSKIVRALPTRQETLVWTDTHLYALQFLGTNDVFGLQEYADNISIMSSRSVVSASNVTYWMGKDKFYRYTGRVETLPCTIRNYIFQNINSEQYDQIVCGTNEEWNEIWWFYPDASTNWNNRYVIFNYLEGLWYYGTLERTAWLGNPSRGYPIAASTLAQDDGENLLYQHENGIDANGLPMESFIESSDFDVGEGDRFLLTKRILPDINFQGSSQTLTPEVTLQLRTRNFPGQLMSDSVDNTRTIIEAPINQYTNQVFVRTRARQMILKIMSEGLGVQWQLGSTRLDAQQDGER
jgi:hypothetical protein